MEDNNEKFVNLQGSSSLIITSVLPTDAGYYTCKMSFPYEGVMYEITRTIHLEIVGKHQPLKTLQPLRQYLFSVNETQERNSYSASQHCQGKRDAVGACFGPGDFPTEPRQGWGSPLCQTCSSFTGGRTQCCKCLRLLNQIIYVLREGVCVRVFRNCHCK